MRRTDSLKVTQSQNRYPFRLIQRSLVDYDPIWMTLMEVLPYMMDKHMDVCYPTEGLLTLGDDTYFFLNWDGLQQTIQRELYRYHVFKWSFGIQPKYENYLPALQQLTPYQTIENLFKVCANSREFNEYLRYAHKCHYDVEFLRQWEQDDCLAFSIKRKHK